jgi:hypothetical protein
MSERGYKTIAISMYDGDLERLDAKVADLKARGYRRTGRSQLIRLALSVLDTRNVAPVEEVPTKITSKPVVAADLKATEQAEPVRHECICKQCGAKFGSRSRTRTPLFCRGCARNRNHPAPAPAPEGSQP